MDKVKVWIIKTWRWNQGHGEYEPDWAVFKDEKFAKIVFKKSTVTKDTPQIDLYDGEMDETGWRLGERLEVKE